MSDIIETIDWAISTIENKLMFGLDEKNAQFARDNRVKAVLRDCRKELKEKDKEIEALNDCIELQKSGLKRFEKENKELKEFAREFWNCNKDLELQFHIENNFQDLISKLESEK